MSIWTCKTALIAGVFLAGCSDVQNVFAVKASGSQSTPPPKQIVFGKGKIQLAAPDGFCIDPGSVKDHFALMARCDALGGQNLEEDAPLAVITASLVAAETQSLPDHAGLAAKDEQVIDQSDVGDLRLISVSGRPPVGGLSDRYWRGAGLVGPYVLGLAIYTHADALDLGDKGPAILAQAFDRTQSQSVAQAVTYTGPPKPTSESQPARNNHNGGLFAGLFQ
ncbi:MAG: hypothetical protein ABJQ34_06555 [Paracoccaceae bacterium]